MNKKLPFGIEYDNDDDNNDDDDDDDDGNNDAPAACQWSDLESVKKYCASSHFQLIVQQIQNEFADFNFSYQDISVCFYYYYYYYYYYYCVLFICFRIFSLLGNWSGACPEQSTTSPYHMRLEWKTMRIRYGPTNIGHYTRVKFGMPYFFLFLVLCGGVMHMRGGGSGKQVIGNGEHVSKLKDWLKAWNDEKTKANYLEMTELHAWMGDSHSDDDYYCDESEFNEEGFTLSNAMLLYGPIGVCSSFFFFLHTGKTCSVYACAAELDIEVIEVNCCRIGCGKELLNAIGEATQSHQINPIKATNTPKKRKLEAPASTDRKRRKTNNGYTLFFFFY
ncbi:hypothetical protein RFI_19644 [Reticulomyxa filosa]|uniref:Uncharacterized protein n=1 Tax=Reticulomyxa filosa TaxID=46433 RepID=X6MX58_RETFI|nr:hypothetical protein RFI_19644 [Reticulomyxa filosa]|eukprot:ETO17675.1 hypothetical protein RFI_19644 [Reticulomyxa filosa]